MIPLRVKARKKDEERVEWWVLAPDGKSYICWDGSFEWACKHELIVSAQGRADQDELASFPLSQHERYQPARHG